MKKLVHNITTGQVEYVDLTPEEIADVRARQATAEQTERDEDERRKNEPTLEKAMRMIEELRQEVIKLRKEMDAMKKATKMP